MKNCRDCKKEIVFLPTKNGKTMPTNWESLNSIDQRGYREKFVIEFNSKSGHVSHFSDCPAADKFRKPKEAKCHLK